MSLQVVGAGLGRTGTHSLKNALEVLLGGPCYHMIEVLAQPDRAPAWSEAFAGKPIDWDQIMDGYVAAVDWPACAFWQELADVNPNAMVLLSTRSSADAWYKSANATIFEITKRGIDDETFQFGATMLSQKFTPDWQDEAAAKRAVRGAQRERARVRTAGTLDRLAAGRRLGTDLRCARASGSERTIPAREHHRRLPRDGRARSALVRQG